jgi:hypothetical protein
MPRIAGQMLPVTGGVDTHADVHVAAVVDQVGRVLGTESFPATAAGYQAALALMRSRGELAQVGSRAPAVMAPGCASSARRQVTAAWTCANRASSVGVVETAPPEPAARLPYQRIVGEKPLTPVTGAPSSFSKRQLRIARIHLRIQNVCQTIDFPSSV